MKWPKEQVDIITDAFQQFIDNCGYSKEEILENYKGNPPMFVVNKLWWIISYDIKCKPDHPAFAEFGRKRHVEYNPDFVLSPRGCNDGHLNTVLKHVKKTLDL